jgi:hypothetical protein
MCILAAKKKIKLTLSSVAQWSFVELPVGQVVERDGGITGRATRKHFRICELNGSAASRVRRKGQAEAKSLSWK